MPQQTPEVPLRHVSVTDSCWVCGGPLPAGRQRSTCSDGCRSKAYRLRHQPRATIPELLPAQSRKTNTVYECPACGIRILGEQHCECGSFMAKVGPGGICPSCDEPVTFSELTDT